MQIFFGGWLSWVATLLGFVVAAFSALAVYRFFRDTHSRLVAPIAWLVGYSTGGLVMVSSLSYLANWHHSPAILTIVETSWLQKVLILLAPCGGLLVPRLLDHLAVSGDQHRSD